MRYALPALAAAAAVNAQGITEYIAPKASAPPGCQPNVDGHFAIHAVPIIKNVKRQLSTSTTTSTFFETTTIAGSVVTVTSHVKPTSTSTETDVITSYTTTTPTATIGTPTGQPQNPQNPPASSVVPIGQINDGQIQDPSMMTVTGVSTMLSTMVIPSMISQIDDGQLQAPPSMALVTSVSTMVSSYTSVVPMPTTSSTSFRTITLGTMSVGPSVSQIDDGQVQARAEPTSMTEDEEYYYEETTDPLNKRQQQCIKWVKKCHRIRNKCSTYCERWAPKVKREVMQVSANGTAYLVYAEAWEVELTNSKRAVAANSGYPMMMYYEQIDKHHVRESVKGPDGTWTNRTVYTNRFLEGVHDMKNGLKTWLFGTNTVKRDVEIAQADPSNLFACASNGGLELTLKNGTLLDSSKRTGAIVGNRQFQFDGPAQSGSIYTGGWSVCGNGSLALGGSTVFYSCNSGDFSNLYDTSIAPYCQAVHLQTVNLKHC